MIIAAIMVKNEAHNLQGLFVALKPLVDRIVLMDTGSSDGTPEAAVAVARGLRIDLRVLHHPWTGDWAEMRNLALDAALRAAAGPEDPQAACSVDPWTFWFDADDRLRGGAALRAAIVEADETEAQDPGTTTPVLGLRCTSQMSGGGAETAMQVRGWRRSVGLRFIYPCHPRPAAPPITERHGLPYGDPPGDVGTVPGVWIDHIGYQDEAHKAANWTLNLKACRERMPKDHPHRAHCEVRALIGLGRIEEAVAVAQEAIDHILPEDIPQEVYLMAAFGAITLDHDKPKAIDLLGEALIHQGREPDLWFTLLQVAAIGYTEACVGVAQGENPAMTKTMSQAPDVVAALFQTGVLDAKAREVKRVLELLMTFVQGSGAEGDPTASNEGGGAPSAEA